MKITFNVYVKDVNNFKMLAYISAGKSRMLVVDYICTET